MYIYIRTYVYIYMYTYTHGCGRKMWFVAVPASVTNLCRGPSVTNPCCRPLCRALQSSIGLLQGGFVARPPPRFCYKPCGKKAAQACYKPDVFWAAAICILLYTYMRTLGYEPERGPQIPEIWLGAAVGSAEKGAKAASFQPQTAIKPRALRVFQGFQKPSITGFNRESYGYRDIHIYI